MELLRDKFNIPSDVYYNCIEPHLIDFEKLNDYSIEALRQVIDKLVEYGIIYAVERGFVNVVKLLLADDRVDPTIRANYAICEAARMGYIEIVKLLLNDERVDHTGNNSYSAICWAADKNHVDVVKLLLKVEPFTPNANTCKGLLRIASRADNMEIIKLVAMKLFNLVER